MTVSCFGARCRVTFYDLNHLDSPAGVAVASEKKLLRTPAHKGNEGWVKFEKSDIPLYPTMAGGG